MPIHKFIQAPHWAPLNLIYHRAEALSQILSRVPELTYINLSSHPFPQDDNISLTLLNENGEEISVNFERRYCKTKPSTQAILDSEYSHAKIPLKNGIFE